MKKLSLVTAIAATFALTACGGSGSNDSKANTTPTVKPTNPVANMKVADGVLKEKAKASAIEGGFTLDGYSVKVGNNTYKDGNGIDLAKFGKGQTVLPVVESATGRSRADGKKYTAEEYYNVYLFTQNYSMIGAIHNIEFVLKDASGKVIEREKEDDLESIVKGQATETLPTTGKFNYAGTAWLDGKDKATLSYDVDFGSKMGSGKITGHRAGEIALESGNIQSMIKTNDFDKTKISGHGISSIAKIGSEYGNYELGFFGPNAEEIVGEIDLDRTSAGIRGIFGGTKK